jgi:ABC-type multidrug transport system permease subunit
VRVNSCPVSPSGAVIDAFILLPLCVICNVAGPSSVHSSGVAYALYVPATLAGDAFVTSSALHVPL